MSISLNTFEGRLIAQRQLLARLVHAHGDDMRTYLRDKSQVHSAEEDPGSDDPSDGYAIEAAMADEMRLILQAVERLD